MGRPHLFFFLQDDLGSDDVTFYNGNQVNADVTGNITAAAREGIILRRLYVHWHCSPTRRTFLCVSGLCLRVGRLWFGSYVIALDNV